MGKFTSGKITVLALLATTFAASVLMAYSFSGVSAKRDHDDPTPTPTATPNEVKVDVCHKSGQSGNYSKINVSVHSVNDANGLNGHGDHDHDIWAPFTFNGVNYSGNGDYTNRNFNDCSRLATPTSAPTTRPTVAPTTAPTVAPTQAPTASPTASPTPTATPANFEFPSCVNYLGQEGDKAHYSFGLHQIVGGPLLWGSDDVFTLTGGNYLQCFCPVEGNEGIQTNWLRSLTPIQGWYFENGVQWNLGNYTYAAQNVEFNCDPADPTPTPTPVPTATPSATDDPNDLCQNVAGIQTFIPEGWYRLDGPSFECRQFQYGGPESSHKDNPGSPAVEGYGIGGGQVLGASTMAGTGTFAENFSLAIMIFGATLSFLGTKYLNKAQE